LGRIYVSLARHQGGTTREAAAPNLAWDIEEQAHKSGLELVEVLPFHLDKLSGYEYKPKRAYVDSTFPSSEARIHIFKVKGNLPTEEDGIFRSLLSGLGSFILDHFFGRLTQGHDFLSAGATIRALEPDVGRSSIAMELHEAAVAFQEVRDLLTPLGRENPIHSKEVNLVVRHTTMKESIHGFVVHKVSWKRQG
jgi:hypothetical protein